MASLVALTADLAKKYGVAFDRVVGHRDVFTDTTCPGRSFPWAEFKQALRAKLAGR
jgi:N-acetyl-anhydromuramyl-L-alanine amidase AmpD